MYQVNNSRPLLMSCDYFLNIIGNKCVFSSAEYVIAFLGSIEGGLAVTTVNPGYTIEEICRQFVSCEPKAVFCLLEHVKVVREATVLAKQPHIKIIAIKSETERAWDNGVINFDELINPKGEYH